MAEFANTANPDETAHNEPSHPDLPCLPSSLRFFQHNADCIESFLKFCRCDFVAWFIGTLRIS